MNMWNTIGVAIRGRGHRERGIPCQDAIYSLNEEGCSIIALADGAGSASHSHYGAQAVVEMMAHYVNRKFDSLYKSEEVESVQSAIATELQYLLKELEETYQVDAKAFASTLLLVAVKGERALILHLGDGEIGAIQNGESVLISSGWNGEYSNATVFTTSHYATDYMKLIKSKNASKFEGFFLLSDGSAESLYSKQSQHFSPLFSQLSWRLTYYNQEALQKQLEHDFEQTVIQRTKDDCSFIMMSQTDYKVLNSNELRHLYSHLPKVKGNSFRKMDAVYQLLKERPMTKTQLRKTTHQKKRIINRVLRILNEQQLIVCNNGKYTIIR